MITDYHAQYYAHELMRRYNIGGVDRLSQSLFDASVDLNPRQIEAAQFALRNPLQQGVLLADEAHEEFREQRCKLEAEIDEKLDMIEQSLQETHDTEHLFAIRWRIIA